MNISLSNRVREVAKEYGISVRQLELRLGFSQKSIQKWDDHTPNIWKIVAVADFFGITVDSLLGREPAQVVKQKVERIDLLDADDRKKVDAIIEAFLADAKYKKSDKVGM